LEAIGHFQGPVKLTIGHLGAVSLALLEYWEWMWLREMTALQFGPV